MNDPYRSETEACPSEPLPAPTHAYRTPAPVGEPSELEKVRQEIARRRRHEAVYLQQVRHGSGASKVSNFFLLLGTQVQILSREIVEVLLRLDERIDRIEERLKKIEEERRE